MDIGSFSVWTVNRYGVNVKSTQNQNAKLKSMEEELLYHVKKDGIWIEWLVPEIKRQREYKNTPKMRNK